MIDVGQRISFNLLKKIRRKINQNEMKFQTLYAIVNDEIDNQTTNARNSATDALLWLKRSLFVLFFRIMTT